MCDVFEWGGCQTPPPSKSLLLLGGSDPPPSKSVLLLGGVDPPPRKSDVLIWGPPPWKRSAGALPEGGVGLDMYTHYANASLLSSCASITFLVCHAHY